MYAAATNPVRQPGPIVSETTPAECDEGWAHRQDVERLGFGGVVESPSALAAKQDAACNNRRTPNSHKRRAREGLVVLSSFLS